MKYLKYITLSAITLALPCCYSNAQTPTAGSVGFTVKSAGAGSTLQWAAPGTPPSVFGIAEGGAVSSFRLDAETLEVVDGVLTVVGGGSGGGTWGTITGTLSAQTDLQTALNAKLAITTAASTYAPIEHTHIIEDIDTLSDELTALNTGKLGISTAASTYVALSGSYADPSWITSLAKSKVGLGSVENTALSTWTGSSSLTTLGTISAGTWQGTAIADSYISSASAWNAKGNASGPGSSTDNGIPRFDGTTGKLLQSSGATISDSGIVVASGFASTGAITSDSEINAATDLVMGNSGHYLRSAGGEFNIAIFPDKGGVIRYVPLVESTSGLVDVANEITGTLPIANGGTGATSASAARTALGLVIGTDVLAPNGSGASLTSLNASALASGTVGTARLGSGTASSSTFLRGDGTWATPSGSGDVVGPSSATDNALARFDATTGKLIQNSAAELDDAGVLITKQLSAYDPATNEAVYSYHKADSFVFGQEEGTLTLRADTFTSTWTFTLPLNPGDNGQFLITDGSGTSSWATIPLATPADDGLMSQAFANKLTDIEANADVTDATNVAAAGAVMESDTSTASMSFVVDEDDMASNSATKVPSQQSVKAYVDANSGGGGGGATTIWIDASAMIPRVTNGAGVNSSETTTNKVNYDTLDFDAGTQEYAQKIEVLPDNWSAGTITATFYWTAGSGSGDVVWSMAARSLANDDALDTARGTAQTVTDTLIAAGDMHVTSATSAVTIAGTPAVGAPVILEVSRVSGDGADTLAVDARLIGVLVTY